MIYKEVTVIIRRLDKDETITENTYVYHCEVYKSIRDWKDEGYNFYDLIGKKQSETLRECYTSYFPNKE